VPREQAVTRPQGEDLDVRLGGAPHPSGQTRARLLAVIATVLVLAFLKWSQVVTMPLAFAVFVIAVMWPLQERLQRHLPRWASLVLTVLVLLLVVALFVGALYWSGSLVAERAPLYEPKLRALYGQLEGWARSHGISLGSQGQGGGSGQVAGDLAKRAGGAAAGSVSLILLILALAILGLTEVSSFKRKTEHGFRHPERGPRIIESSRAIAARFQRYLVARTIAAILQGITVGLFALVIGLDFAFVWGVLAFLLNYIPSIGSVVAVIPPSLFALVQFDGLGRPLAVLAGMAILQIVMGNYLDPLIEGKYLSISPVVVLISIVFWGWIWGVGGALLGVPLTVGIMITSDQFPQTRWIARLLAEAPNRDEG